MRTGILFICLFILGCDSPPEAPIVIRGMTMGTNYSISLVSESQNTMEELQTEIDALLVTINNQMSTYLDNSELSRINQNKSDDWIDISPELYEVISTALEIGRLTGGEFDITVGNMVNLWGFGPDNLPVNIPDDESIKNALNASGYHGIEMRSPAYAIKKQNPDIYLDLSGIAKGYAVDRVSDYLEGLNFQSYLVDIGGEIRAKGQKQDGEHWRIGIEKPLVDGREVQRVIPLSDMAMATSGDYRNFFIHDGIRYSHTIDPRTGRPILHNLLSVTVLDDSAMVADAMATALMVMGPGDGIIFAEKNGISAYFIQSDPNEISEKISSRFARYLGE
jgi:thiamine biosynthesis lipoprotein